MVALALFWTLTLDTPPDSDRMGYREKSTAVWANSPAGGDLVRLMAFPYIPVQYYEAELT